MQKDMLKRLTLITATLILALALCGSVSATSDVGVNKTVDNSTPNVGDTVTFTINVTNYGPDATPVIVSDYMSPGSSGFQYVNHSATTGTYDSSTGLWNITNLANGASATLIIQAIVLKSGNLTNTAFIIEPIAGVDDPNPANQWSTVILNVPPAADVAVNKTVNNTLPNIGETIRYIITITNNGPDNATNVIVDDTIPFTFTNVVPTPGANLLLAEGISASSGVSGIISWTGSTLTFNLTNMVSGGYLTYYLDFLLNNTTDLGSSFNNTASLTSMDQYDWNSSNNQSSAVFTIPIADIAVDKTVDNANPNYLDNVTFTVTLTNNGPNDAANVFVYDLLPAGFSLVSATPSVGSYNNLTGIWTIGTLANGATETLTLVAQVLFSNATLTNTANATSTTYDPDMNNNNDSVNVTVAAAADIGVTKTVSDTTPDYRDYILWTITVHNYGPNDASDVQISDLIPAGLSIFGSPVVTQGTYTAGVWNIGNMTNGSTVTLQIITQVLATGNFTNNASVINTESEYDWNMSNNNASASIEVQAASDIEVVKTADNLTPNYGSNVSMTITVTNRGPDNATGVQIRDVIPAGFELTSATPSVGTYDNATGIWTIGNLANQSVATLVLNGTIRAVGNITNNASLYSLDQNDWNSTNDNDSVTLEVPPAVDIEVNKTANNSTVHVGQNVIYTITVRNNGPSNATNVVVSDVLPSGLQYVSYIIGPASGVTPGSIIWTPGTNTFTISGYNITSGGYATFSLIAEVLMAAAGTNVSNTAALVSVDQFDWNDTNNESTVYIEVPPAVDIAVNKTVDNATPNVGDTITYTIVVSNNGPNTATGVVVTDVLPAGLQYVGFTGPVISGIAAAIGSWNTTSNTFTIIGAFTNGSSATFTLIATVLRDVANQTVNNTAALVNVAEYDWNNTNNESTVSIDVQPAVDIAVEKTVDNATPGVGQTITYTIVVSNNGPNDATNVAVTDVLPAGLLNGNVIIGPSSGATPGSVIWNVITNTLTISGYNITSGGYATFTISALVNMSLANQTVGNTAALVSVDQFDWNNTNNESTVYIDVPPAVDIAVEKTVDNATPNVGDTITYTIVVSNNGPNNATNAIVTDVLPAGLQYVTIGIGPFANAAGAATWNASSNTLTINGSYGPGGYLTFYLVADVLMDIANQTVNNTAALVSVDQFDWNNTNNNSTATIEVQPAADVAVTKTVDNATPNYMDNVTFTVTVTNNGPNTAVNTLLSDLLGAGFSFVSATPSVGSYDDSTGVWTIGDLLNGTSATLTLVAQVLGHNETLTNVANASSETFDWNMTNNEANASVTVPPAVDIEVIKEVNNTTPNVGETISYTFTVRNNGPDTATNVILTDLLPTGLHFVSWAIVDSSGALGIIDTITIPLTAQFLSIAPGGYAIFQGNATVNMSLANTTVDNTMSLVSVDQYDWNNTNNESTATIEVQPAADVAVTKTVDNATPNYMDNVTFTVTVTNNGPNTAVNTLLSDLLGAGFSFVSATPSVGSYDDSTGVWTIGDLLNGTSATLTLVAQVLGHNETLTNVANASSETFDWNMTNNEANASVTVPPAADMEIFKTVLGGNINYMNVVVFSIAVQNEGPDSALNVNVIDFIPAGLIYAGSTLEQGTFDNSTGIWTIGDVLPGQYVYGNFSFLIVASNTTLINTVNVTTDSYDYVEINNQAQSAIVVPPAADVVVTKEFLDWGFNPITTANYKDVVLYRVHVTNNGPDSATGLQITDPIPAGLTFGTLMYGYVTSYDGGWSWNFDDGTFDTSTGVWTIPYDLAPGQEFLLDVWCNVTGSNMTIVNIANKTAQTDYDWNTSNDNATASLDIPPAVDIVVDKQVDNDHPQIGDLVTWVIEVSNFGPDNATGVQIFDLLPAGVTFVSYIADAGTYNETTGIWDIGNFPAFTTLVLNITTIVNPANGSSNVTNNASVANVDQYDWNTLNDESSAILYLPVSDISITKSADKTSMNVGENVIWTITVTNNGPNFATNVNISDLLPAGMQFVTAIGDGAGWTFVQAGNSFNATLANIAAGASRSFNITMTALPVSAGTNQTNMANMTSLDQYDPDNASGNATVYVKAVDVVVNKTVNNTTPNYRTNVTYTVTATNNGPDNATGVVVTDLLPAGMSFVSATPSVGSYVSATGIWTIGNLASGASATLQIIAQVMDANKTITNTANLTAVTEYDTNSSNNGSSVSIYVPPSADIAVTKTTTNNNPLVCENFNWTITVVNNGPNDATGVMVSDILPAGLNLLSFTPSQGTYNTATGVWAVGTLLNGSTATLVFVVNATHALCGVTTTNNAYKLAEDQYDWNSSNNIGSSSIQVPGDTTYSVKVTNNGVSLIQCVYYITVYPPCGAAPILNRYVFNLNPGQSRTITLGTYCVGTRISTDEFVYNRATGTRTISVTNVWAATGFAPYVQPFVVTNVPAGGLTHAMKRFWTTKDALNVYIVSPPRRM